MDEEKTGYVENPNFHENYSEKITVEVKYARLWERIIAGIIDHAICLILLLVLLFTLFNSYISLIFFSSIYFGSVFFVMTFIIEFYYFAFEKFCKGQTPGKMFMEIEVINSSSHTLFLKNLFIRNFLRCSYLLPPLFLIPDIIIIVFNKEHKRFGDLIADTVVVKKYIG